MQRTEIPLFPLHTVLFPGGILPLRIFEPRYLDMVSRCLKDGKGFGVVAIQEGHEVGKAARCYETATLARIVDFDRLEDGLLGITCQGEQRLRIIGQRVQADQLLIGQVELLPAEVRIAPTEKTATLVSLLKDLLDREELLSYRHYLQADWDDAGWVGNRLAELLPLPVQVKQALLVFDDPLQRLEVLYAILKDQQVI